MNKTGLILTLAVGVPLLAFLLVRMWRRSKTSSLWRFIFCFVVACLVTPAGFSNGHSEGGLLPVVFLLPGIFNGEREDFVSALKLIGFLVIPVSLLLFGIYSAVLRKRRASSQGQDNKALPL